MDRTEHLLVILMEECAEVAQECSKALRFGLDDMYSETTVRERLEGELADLVSVMEMVTEEAELLTSGTDYGDRMVSKKAKIEKFLAYSAERGRLMEKDAEGERQTLVLEGMEATVGT